MRCPRYCMPWSLKSKRGRCGPWRPLHTPVALQPRSSCSPKPLHPCTLSPLHPCTPVRFYTSAPWFLRASAPPRLSPTQPPLTPLPPSAQPVDELTALPITYTLAHLLDQPHTRCYLPASPATFLHALLSPLTELESPNGDSSAALPPERETLMRVAHLSVCALGSTWAGLLSLASEPHGLRALLRVVHLCHSTQAQR